MSYHVLARKWRPRFFREMVGQEHVLQALINALDHDRLHHAYLFTGTRGVGKTTIARILAKCLNCETGVSSEPCGQCSSCQEINNGSFIDLIEIDAASRTKVEEMRDLLDNVQYAPSKGRYKVYLIDEVHMLSAHSFNALLKTLEEPPEHVKFLLATTDPQKLPATILSRCLQFHLKNMVPEHIVNHLATILQKEVIDFEEPALWALARSAEGSMRDALSLTDQAIAFGSGKILESEVRAMLGSIDQQTVYHLALALVNHEPQALLNVVAEFSEQAPDYVGVLDELLLLLHRMTIAQLIPGALDNSLGDKEQVEKLAASVTAEELQLFYQMGLLGKRDIHLAPDLRTGLEMALVRMLAFRPEGSQEPPVKTPVSENRPASQNEGTTSASVAENETPEAMPAKAATNPGDQLDEKQEAEDCLKKPEMAETAGHNEARSSQPQVLEDNNKANEPSAAITVREDEHNQSKSESPESSRAAFGLNELTNNDAWKTRFYELPFRGLLKSVAAECVLISRNADRFDFAINTTRAQLYNESHGEQMASVLSEYFGVAIELNLQTAEVDMQTPAQYLEQQNQAIYDAALQQLENDPGIQQLIRDFSAHIVKKTVKANDPSIIDNSDHDGIEHNTGIKKPIYTDTESSVVNNKTLH